ncbi:MAG: type II CAAX endopeptidase family protein [Gemmatimonadota bacterium]
MITSWQRLPVTVRAVISGGVMAAAGTLPWALLASANARYVASVPWAVPVTVLYLWFFWRYARGEGWPAATAAARRTSHRANRLSDDVWGAALFAGMLGLITVVLFQLVMNRLVRLPAQPVDDLAGIPRLTLLFLLIMSAVVSGVVEETSFRGYMQGPIERRHGPVIAILVTGLSFGFAHFTHPEVTLILMPYYLVVAAVYGIITHLTNSIFPAMVLHAGGNLLTSFDLLARGQAEWQASSTPTPLIWETGADASFLLSLLALLFASAASLWAFKGLAQLAGQDLKAVETSG